MKKICVLLGLTALLLFSGCGYKEGVKTDAQRAYLFFSGHVEGALISIDGGTAFEVQAGPNNRYETSPGKHTLEVIKDGTVIIKRVIFIDDGVAKEINIR